MRPTSRVQLQSGLLCSGHSVQRGALEAVSRTGVAWSLQLPGGLGGAQVVRRCLCPCPCPPGGQRAAEPPRCPGRESPAVWCPSQEVPLKGRSRAGIRTRRQQCSPRVFSPWSWTPSAGCKVACVFLGLRPRSWKSGVQACPAPSSKQRSSSSSQSGCQAHRAEGCR